jgi:sugar/nucleoside kinase (ribokinase family)
MLTVVGNLTLDEVASRGRVRVVPGGSALYVSAAAAFIGSLVRVVSRVGPDYPGESLRWLRRKGIDVSHVTSGEAATTRFRLSYRGSFRELRIINPGEPLSEVTLAQQLGMVHLGPVFGEISPRMIPSFSKASSLVSIDLQGFLRRRTEGGRVRLKPAKIGSAFSSVDIVKATAEEVKVQTSEPDTFSAARKLLRQGAKRLMISLGRQGALFVEKSGRAIRVPAYPEPYTLDPTGAGDSLVGGWLATFQRTRDSAWSAAVGSAMASMVVRRHGPSKFLLSREELLRRSAWVYHRIIPVKS